MDACYCDYDGPSVFRKSMHKSRKARRCGECGCDIRIGDRYEYAWGKWDGMIDQFHTCERCVSFRDWLIISLPCFCWAYGNMIDDAKETIQDAMWRERVPGFAFEAGRHLVKIRRRCTADAKARYPRAA